MSSGGIVNISADKILALADKLRDLESEIRELGLEGFEIQPAPRAPQKQSPKVMNVDIDVSHIMFKQKKLADESYAIAGPHAKWGWDHGYTQEGDYQPESRELVQNLERYGSVKIGKRTYTLGGRDGKLLQFKET